MLLPLGFAWLLYSVLNPLLENEDIIFNLDGVMTPIEQYISDSNHLFSWFTSIATGINTIYGQVPPLIIYFVGIAITLTIIAFFVRLVVDIL